MEETLNATEEWTPAEDFDTGLTADDWKEILEDDDFIRTHPVGLITLWLYYKNNSPSSYADLEQMLYGDFCSAGMTQFTTGIDSKFKEKINQFTDETGKPVYWSLSFKRKKSVKNFIYKLRKEVREGFDKLSKERRQKFEQLETSLFFTAKFFIFLKEHYGWQDLPKSKIAFKNNPLICIFKDKWSLRMYERWSGNIPYLLLHEGENGIHSSDRNVLNLALDLTVTNEKVSWNPARQNRSNKENKEISFPTFENSDQNDVFKQLAQLISKRTSETMNNETSFKLNPKEKEWLEKLLKSRQIILTGAPGTGKSYAAHKIANALTGNKSENIEFVQFHPSMDYTDFVEGLRPIKGNNGQIGFERRDGIFKAFCKRALENQEKFVFIIDEINRGDISKIFGELFFAIDPSYRGEKGKITTQYQNLVESDDSYADGFYIPENVYIIGTMNDIDRGVESMDFAIRRRFTWIEVNPEDTQSMLDSLSGEIADNAKKRMNALNDVIKKKIGSAYQIGAAYFLRLRREELKGDFAALWAYHLEPLLREYLRGDPRAEEFLAEMKKAYDAERE